MQLNTSLKLLIIAIVFALGILGAVGVKTLLVSNSSEAQTALAESETEASDEKTDDEVYKEKGYSVEQQQIAKTLQSYTWIASDTQYLTFTAAAATLTSTADETVMDYSLGNPTTTSNADDTVISVPITIDSTTEVLEIVQPITVAPYLRCASFSTNASNVDTYTGTLIVAEAFTITGDEDGTLGSVLGEQYQDALAAIKSYANTISPKTTSAKWSEKVSVDYDKSILETTFTLENTSKTTIKLTINNGEILVSKG